MLRHKHLAPCSGLAALGLAVAALSQSVLGPVARASASAELVTSQTAAVSFAPGRRVALVNGRDGSPVGALQARRAPRDLAFAASSDRLFVAEHAAIESLDPQGASAARTLRWRGADRLVTDPGTQRLYVTRARPTGVAAVMFGTTTATLWTTPLAGSVRALALDPSGRTLLAASGERAGVVAMLDTHTGVVQRIVSVKRPVALAITHDGRTAYAASGDDGTLTAISLADGQQHVSVGVAKHPQAVAIGPDDTSIYLADAGANKLVVIDRSTLTVAHTVKLPGRPRDVAVTPDGSTVIVAVPNRKALVLIDAGSLRIIKTQRFPHQPKRIVFVPASTASPTLTPAPTATVMPTAGLPISPGATMVPTLSPPGGGPSATGTPAGHGSLEGVAVGEVFDDGSAQPLRDVTVAVAHGGTTVTDAGGRYTLTAPAGAHPIELAKDGYTRCVRDTQITPGFATQPLDARLTVLGDPVAIGPDGGTVRATYRAPDGSGDVELQMPPNALSNTADIRLTVVSPQGLIAPLPRGWSVLLGFDVQPAPLAFMMPATLRVPLSLLASIGSLPMTTAQWDDETMQWRKGPAATANGDTVRITLTSLGQLALVVPDTLPVTPPSVADGDPLLGVLPFQSAWDGGLVAVDPEVIPAGAPQGVHVLTRVHSLSPCPSGTLFEAQVRQKFDLRDGRQIVDEARRQDLIEYQLGPDVTGNETGGGSLHAYFTLVPSRTFALGELTQGLVTIDLLAKPAAPQADVIDPSGGTAKGDHGLRLEIPPNAVDRTTVVALTPTSPDALPPEVKNRPDFVGAVEIQIDGGVFNPTATYGIGLSASLADGQRFVLARLLSVSDGTSAAIVGLGTAANGIIHFDACVPGTGLCLNGLSGSGTYVIFSLPSDTALLTGTVTEGGHARSGIIVRSDTAPVASESDAEGRYLSPAPVGVTSTLRAHDSENDLDATRSVRPSDATVVPLDLVLQPSPPEVTQVDPPNHGANVATDATVTITFSKPIAVASVTEASVLMRQPSTAGVTPVGVRLSLSADGTTLLLTPGAALKSDALYQVVLTDHVTDRAGNALTGDGPVRFQTDFTTAPAFTADALPPNTLRVSLPDDQGRVLVCGGAQLAAPGTAVVVMNAATGLTATGAATDRDGVSGSDVCDTVFSGRCDTAAPGSFCLVLDATLGDRIQLNVEDVLHNAVTLDAGNMRDERTGATAVGPGGGHVVSVEDPRYAAEIPVGAFDAVRTVTLFPVRDDELPVRLDESSGLHRLGALFLDFGDDDVVAAQEIDLTIPAPADADPNAQFLVGHVINFRGRPELTLVDDASLGTDQNGAATLSTNSPPFPGATRAGFYDFSTPNRAVGYAIGVVDKQHSTMDVLPTSLTYVFPFLEPNLTKFAMPVVADEPFSVTLTGADDAPVDRIDIQGPPRGRFVELPRSLSDDTTPATVDGFSVPNEATNIAGDTELVLALSRPVEVGADGLVAPGAIDARDQNGRVIDGTWAPVGLDGRHVRFFPQRPLPPASTITVTLIELRDRSGKFFRSFSSKFVTFTPLLVATVPLAANDIDVLHRTDAGVARPYALVARDADPATDDQGGIVAVDVRNPRAPRIVGEARTAGVDRAVRVASATASLVLSLDSAGDPQRFGTLRAFDFTDPSAPVEVGRRVLNLSPETISEQIFLPDIPPEGGVPLSMALLGGTAVYVADPPTIGVEAVTLSRIIPPHNEIEGVFRGGYRAVATLKQFVIAAGQGNAGNELVVLDPALTGVRSRWPLPAAPLALIAVPAYPIDLDGDGNLGIAEDLDQDSTTAADELVDLLLVLCEGHVLYVVQLAPGGIISSVSSFPLPAALGTPRSGAVDPQHRLLYLAAGTAGLAVADFHDPLHVTFADATVLATVLLSGQAKQVRLLTDARGVEYALVAGDRALDIVQVTPGDAGLTIYDTNNAAVIPELFEESDGSFILANNDNDDADADADGRPILDRDDAGRVEGEDDLRRVDIKVPMTEGTLTLDMPQGAAQARVWLTADRDGLFVLPQHYNLSAGERPPETVWIEGIAPSEADRDVRLTFHWEPPPGNGLEPFDDAVVATVVELDFIPGRHPAGTSVDPLGERKTTFLKTERQELKAILAGRKRMDELPQSRFGGVRIRGLGSDSIARATVRTSDETLLHGANAPVVDQTAAENLTLLPQAAQPRTLVSNEDVLLYTGVVTSDDGSPLDPDAVRSIFRSEGVLPLSAEERFLGQTAVQQALVIRSALGEHPPLVGGAAGPAVVEIIDAQAFAKLISAGVRGDQLYDEYLAFDTSAREDLTGMDGALADRWSRLIVRVTVPSTDTHTAFDFHLATDPDSDQANLGSNHLGDEAFPFGLLSLTGFEGFNVDETAPDHVTADGPTLDLTNVKIRGSGRRRSAAVTFTPPGSFPFKLGGAELTEPLKIDVGPTGPIEPWAELSLLLVRPPALFVHGLTGSPQAWGEDFVATFDAAFVTDFVDYGAQSVSGFDTIFSAIPLKIEEVLGRFRRANHQRTLPFQRGERGDHLPDLQDRKIAATKVDVIAHSMGGLAVRWFLTDMSAEVLPQGRQVAYPTASLLGPTAIDGTDFLPIETRRSLSFQPTSTSSFGRGNVRKVVTLSSPQLGSPLANYVTHEVCHDSRGCYSDPLGRLAIVGFLGTRLGSVPPGASNVPDFGTAIYDLSQGSKANKLIQDVASESIPVHAIAATKPGVAGNEILQGLETGLKLLADPAALGNPLRLLLAPGLSKYCAHFSGDDSDLIVPLSSQLYGTRHHTILPGFWHLEVNQERIVALEISDRLLYDAGQPPNRDLNSFDAAFPAGQPWPLNCQ